MFEFPRYITALQGSCVHIPCTYTHPEGAKDFNFFWYSKRLKIFNNKTRSDVDDMYKGRTFLTGNTENDCSIKIINISSKYDKNEYFPGINAEINSNELQNKKVSLFVSEYPPKPSIKGNKHMKEKQKVNITCSVEHTCPSSPPTLTWNITGYPILESHEDLQLNGGWRMESILTYTSSITDDKTGLKCAAVFPNYKTSVKTFTLNIRYRPMNVIISVDGNTDTAEDEDVTLLCSSQANPPVDNYTWYQISQGEKFLQGYGDKITVKNTTKGKYFCVAANEMGTNKSPVFKFSEKQKDPTKVYVGIGITMGLVFILVPIVVFFIYRRKRKTVLKMKSAEQIAQEAIAMDDHVYGNIDQQQGNIPRPSFSELQDSSPIYNNTDADQSIFISQPKEELFVDSDGVLYSLLHLPVSGQVQPMPATSAHTEYATIQH
ncbi:sialic acid-binding Ig-like lectin 13 [Pyxicephalus adspersus]|uniref:sialic acid-binding Ig-like lectin 13 n=1 Tax=Pyxicephalus adspersus TaxID=30357 RepID=UPI003B5C5FAF